MSARSGVLHLSFNQDFSCLAVGTQRGFDIFQTHPFAKCFTKPDGAIKIVEMLYCTSLVAIVGAGEQPSLSPRRLQLLNTKTQQTICELSFPNTILSVKMNRKRLVVVLENKIYLYDVNTMRLSHTLDTAPNPRGICAFSPSSESCQLAFPANALVGDVLLFDAMSLQTLNVIQQAHKSVVSCLAFNDEATLLATTSEKGTIVRVFAAPSGTKLFVFRRGSYPAETYSLCFNEDSTLLCGASDTGTLHIWALQPPAEAPPAVSAYLPGMISDMWEPVRHVAHAKLPNPGVPCACAFRPAVATLAGRSPQGSGSQAQQQQQTVAIVCATLDGLFHEFTVSLETGESRLDNEYALVETEPQHVSAAYV